VGYVEDLHVRCEVPYTPGDLFRQQKRWAYGVMRAFMAHGPKIFLIYCPSDYMPEHNRKRIVVCRGGLPSCSIPGT
jgi:cellulose synthase/poly-beta-1,6-N-acetylglucosamine synthase-like glycosyltransferase